MRSEHELPRASTRTRNGAKTSSEPGTGHESAMSAYLKRRLSEEEAGRAKECSALGLPETATDFEMLVAIRDRAIAKARRKAGG